MKTNQTLTILLIVILLNVQMNSVSGQGAYMSLGGGYNIATASQSLGSSRSFTSRELVKGSLGEGFQAGLVIGTMLNSNVGLEMGVSYLFGSSVKMDYLSGSGYSNSSEASASMLRLLPAVKITSGGEGTKLYLKAGAAIGVGGTLLTKENSTGYFYSSESETKYSGGLAIGFTGSIGAEFKLGANSAFFTEVNVITQSWAPTKSELTACIENGQDILPTLTTSQKETVYENTIADTDYLHSSSTNTGSPSTELKVYLPMSSVGITIGYRIQLSKKEKSVKAGS